MKPSAGRILAGGVLLVVPCLLSSVTIVVRAVVGFAVWFYRPG